MRHLAPRGNLVLSPDSIEAALAMVGTGAAGQTAQQIATALRLRSPGAFDEVGKLQSKIAAEERGGPILNIADALFVAQGFDLRAPFASGLRRSFEAAPQTVNFKSGAGELAVNAWGANQTRGLIPKIVSDLPGSTKLALANAIYLKAEWAMPFNSGSTEPGMFRLGAHDVATPFMHETAFVRYGAGSDYDLVELPYSGSDLALAIVLPRGKSVEDLLAELSATSLSRMLSNSRDRDVALGIPRFHVSENETLNEPLRALGLTDAFSEADFARMTLSRKLELSQVDHAADIVVDEKGTEAAAVTVARLEPLGPKPTPVAFTANHPFLFFLRDQHNGAILFEGRVEDPSASPSGA